MFPAAQDARAVAGCLKSLAAELGVTVKTSHRVETLMPCGGKYEITFQDVRQGRLLFDRVAVTTGGSPRGESFAYLERLGHRIETPVPSLFTFNIASPALRGLMGTVVDPALVGIPGTKFRHSGALLVTHWGMSGPAILKLSSHAARFIQEKAYRFPIFVNWTNESHSETVTGILQDMAQRHPQKKSPACARTTCLLGYGITSSVSPASSPTENGTSWGTKGFANWPTRCATTATT